MLRLFAAALLFPTVLCAPARGEADLGSIAFPTSGSPAAQAHFERGVLYLHSFEYRDARAAFRAAQEAEPGFAMAYWGEAMTYNHPIWLEEDVDSAHEALERLGATLEARLAKAPTEREKDYLRAVEILFGAGDKAHRDGAYAEAMRAMRERYPDDLEAASFYALALMGTCHEGRDFAVYMRAAAVAEEVFDRNPRHPGAVHYLIHATDDPIHAPLGLRAARVYAEIAPAAGHARHMPSHIFLALGMWEDVTASNASSWEAVAARVEREGWAVERNNYHALLWWHYGLLQLDKVDEAEKLLARMAADHEAADTRRTATHLALMRAAHAVDTGRFDVLPPAPDVDGLDLAVASSVDFTDGLAALAAGRGDRAAAAAETILGRIATALEQGRARRDASYTRVGSVRTASAEVMALQLQALAAEKGGDLATALVKANEAAAREEETPFGFGPPVPAKPAREMLGEILLRAGRADEARAQLERAFERTPRRRATTRSLQEATRVAAGRPQARTDAPASPASNQ